MIVVVIIVGIVIVFVDVVIVAFLTAGLQPNKLLVNE